MVKAIISTYDLQVAKQIELLKERNLIVRIPKNGTATFHIKPKPTKDNNNVLSSESTK